MLRNMIMNILQFVWPSLFICSVIFVSLRIAWLIKNKSKINLHNELMMFLFGIYVLCIFYVVTFQDVDWSTSNFIPFREIFRYEFGSRLFFKNVIGNMIMFSPYGFFIGYFIRTNKISVVAFLSILLSLSIETTQLIIGRVFDVDDIMLNLVGAVIGFLIYKVLDKVEETLPSSLKNTTFYGVILLIILAVVALYLFNIGV